MLRILPAAKIAWRDVWVGAAVTTLLVGTGKYLIGFCLGSSDARERVRGRRLVGHHVPPDLLRIDDPPLLFGAELSSRRPGRSAAAQGSSRRRAQYGRSKERVTRER